MLLPKGMHRPDSRWKSTLQKIKEIEVPSGEESTVCETVASFVEYLQLKTRRDQDHYFIIWQYVIRGLRFEDIDQSIQQAGLSPLERKEFWSKGLNMYKGKKGAILFLFLTKIHPAICLQYVQKPMHEIDLQDTRVTQWIKENDFASYKRIYR